MGRRLSVGAEITGGGTHFRVFAPKRAKVDVVLAEGLTVALAPEGDGHFAALAEGVVAGDRYRLAFDDARERLFPDPTSRFQPDGPHGPSEVVDPSRFAWTDGAWRGLELRGQVIYELHVGTFTREGTYAAAARELEELRDLGVTAVELLPLADFPGEFGWGYDGVDLYAPSRLYGRPDDLRAFVDRAHALGLGVLLDVVYNHLGPSGNYLRETSDHFFTSRVGNDWGDAIDFETEPAVRRWFVENAGYWIDEYHLDGLRLDATQEIHDRSPVHVIAEIGARARAAAGTRAILLIAEDIYCDADTLRPLAAGGHGFDAIWNDDFHHAARVAATGVSGAYYSATKGTAQELVSATKWGALFQGQLNPWRKRRCGKPALDVPAPAFMTYLENHDQISHTADGTRFHAMTSAGLHRALTALFLLAPGTPLLFQGQEFAASAPFVFFADHAPDLADAVANGRRAYMERFPDVAAGATILAPGARATFERCKLDLAERATHHATYALFKDLLRLRRRDPIFAAQDKTTLHGATIDDRALVLRFGTGSGDDRLLVVNLGPALDAGTAGEPLLAPPSSGPWTLLFSTEDPRYGGAGAVASCDGDAMPIPGAAALVFAPTSATRCG